MWAIHIVVDPPLFDDAACRCHAAEQVLVEAFVPEAAVQALDEAVLGGLPARCSATRRGYPPATA